MKSTATVLLKFFNSAPRHEAHDGAGFINWTDMALHVYVQSEYDTQSVALVRSRVAM